MTTPAWKDIATGNATMVQTQKRDGTWVSTPVTAVPRGDTAVFSTPSGVAKLKRIRNFPDVRVASCTNSGKLTGDLYSATARILAGAESDAALATIRKAHPISFGIVMKLVYRLRRLSTVTVELSNLRHF